MPAVLGQNFWNKLSKISGSVGMNPADLLAVMYYESGLDPAAHNKNGHASGLIQFMPDTLKGLGFNGKHGDFRELDATTQLDYVNKYVSNQARFNGGGFKSAAQYYVANLWPIALKLPGVQQENPNTAILEKNPTTHKYPGVSLAQEKDAYQSNVGLDVDKDGTITYGDLQAVMNRIKKSSGYQSAIASLNSGKEYIAGQNKPTPKKQNVKTQPKSYLARLNTLLDTFLAAIATNNIADIKKLPKNQIVIKVKSDDLINSLEFARILTAALEEEAQAKSTIYTDRKYVEILCTINGPSEICCNAVSQLCESLVGTFKKATLNIGGVKINTNIVLNSTPSYQELDIKLAQLAYRQFHLKFIK